MVNAGPEKKSPVPTILALLPRLGGGGERSRKVTEEGARWWQEMLCGVWPGAAAQERAVSDPRALQGTNLEAPVPNWGQNALTPSTEGVAALSCWTKQPPSSSPKPGWSRVSVTLSLHSEAPKSDVSPRSAPHKATTALA